MCTHCSGRYYADYPDSVTVIGSWIFRKPLLLLFDTFEAFVLFLSGLALPFNVLAKLYTD